MIPGLVLGGGKRFQIKHADLICCGQPVLNERAAKSSFRFNKGKMFTEVLTMTGDYLCKPDFILGTSANLALVLGFWQRSWLSWYTNLCSGTERTAELLLCYMSTERGFRVFIPHLQHEVKYCEKLGCIDFLFSLVTISYLLDRLAMGLLPSALFIVARKLN